MYSGCDGRASLQLGHINFELHGDFLKRGRLHARSRSGTQVNLRGLTALEQVWAVLAAHELSPGLKSGFF